MISVSNFLSIDIQCITFAIIFYKCRRELKHVGALKSIFNQISKLTAVYTPNEDYLFLDKEFGNVRGASSFIQKRFCKMTEAEMPTDTFTPG